MLWFLLWWDERRPRAVRSTMKTCYHIVKNYCKRDQIWPGPHAAFTDQAGAAKALHQLEIIPRIRRVSEDVQLLRWSKPRTRDSWSWTTQGVSTQLAYFRWPSFTFQQWAIFSVRPLRYLGQQNTSRVVIRWWHLLLRMQKWMLVCSRVKMHRLGRKLQNWNLLKQFHWMTDFLKKDG